MKNTRRCPKCGNDDIFVVRGYAGSYGRGNHIEVGMTVFSSVPVDRYICSRCGFSEEWIRTNGISQARKSRLACELNDEA